MHFEFESKSIELIRLAQYAIAIQPTKFNVGLLCEQKTPVHDQHKSHMLMARGIANRQYQHQRKT